LIFEKVLEQRHADKTLFLHITKNKQQLTVVEITENLCQLLDFTTSSFPITSGSLVLNCALIGKQSYHK